MIVESSRYIPRVYAVFLGRACFLSSSVLPFKLSLRALDKYAPWIRHVYIVSDDGTVPVWMDTSSSRITVIDSNKVCGVIFSVIVVPDGYRAVFSDMVQNGFFPTSGLLQRRLPKHSIKSSQ